jgi:hypothetical protein
LQSNFFKGIFREPVVNSSQIRKLLEEVPDKWEYCLETGNSGLARVALARWKAAQNV